MASKLSKEDYVIFNEGLTNYLYINKDGRLDLEDFCVTLAACIHHDNVGLERLARPENFHQLLIEIIRGRAPEGMLQRWVQLQRLVDWTPQHAYLYPNRHRTYIHVAALIHYSVDWISLIGSHFLEIADEECRPEYFGWAKEDWHFTYMFLSGFHDALFTLAKDVDLEYSSKGSTSSFETLYFCLREKISYDDADKILEMRNQAWSKATARISKAIADEYFLEAITLSENFMSNLLYNYLLAKGFVGKHLSFNSLIQKARPFFEEYEDAELIDKVDAWRKCRNKSIHNFILSSIDDLVKNTDTLTLTSSDTASSGEELVKLMLQWYRSSAVNFIEHDFKKLNLNS